jgi:hypothetical protein
LATDCKKHIVNCQDALLKLEDSKEKIALVIKSVNNFATWWQKMGNDLQDIRAQVISKGDIHEIVTQIRQQLVCLGGPFRAYSSQVRTHFIMIQIRWLNTPIRTDQEAPGLLSGQL